MSSSSRTPARQWMLGRPVPVDFGGPTDIPFERFSAAWLDQALIGRFHWIADRFSSKLAIDDGSVRLTYGEVHAAVSHLAAHIIGLVAEGAPIAAFLDNTAVFPIVFLACLMTGRPIIPVDASYPPDRQAAILRESGAAAIIIGDGLDRPADLPAALPQLTVTATVPAGPTPPRPPIATAIDAPAGVIYTSGSTGRPKGVAFSQRQFLVSIAEYINACHINQDDRLIGLASLGGASTREALAALLTGASFHIADLRRSGIGTALRTLATARITVLAFVPSVLRSFVALPDAGPALANLRILDLFGERITPEAVEDLRRMVPASCHVRACLGSTETMVLFHWFVPRNFTTTQATLPCGYIASSASIALLDNDGMSVAPDEAGEVVVRSRYIASGIWQQGKVVAGPFRHDAHDSAFRIFHTGDLVRLRTDGLAEFVGRRDRRVKIRGLRADPADLEDALHRIPGLAECAVVTRGVDEDTVFLAYVVATQAGALSVRQIGDLLRREVPPHIMPAEIHLIGSMPRLPSFKPDLLALAGMSDPSPAGPAIGR